MKITGYILPFYPTALLAITMILCPSCETRQEPVEIQKASPVRKMPEEKQPEKNIIKKELHFPADSIGIPDSTGKILPQDTTESHRIERKPDIKQYRRLYMHTLYKKALIT